MSYSVDENTANKSKFLSTLILCLHVIRIMKSNKVFIRLEKIKLKNNNNNSKKN